jgi:hypothetical protein
MNKVLITLALMLGIVGCADKADANDWYVQGGAGMTKYNYNGTTKDQEATNYFGAVGYIFDNNLGVEGEYEYVGSADLTSGIKSDRTNNYTLYGVGRVPLDHKDTVYLVLKAGVGYADTDFKVSGGSNPSDNTWYPAIGAGVEWNITDSWGIITLVDYKQYDFSTNGVDLSADPVSYKIGAQYKF